MPSEPTTRWWTSVALIQLHGIRTIEQGPAEALSNAHVFIKKEWKKFKDGIDNCTPASRRPTELPSTAAEFARMHPQWFREVYPDAAPVLCKANLIDASHVRSMYTCRGAGRRPASGMDIRSCQPAKAMNLEGLVHGQTGAMDIFRGFADGMIKLQKQQGMLLDAMSGRKASENSPSPSPRRSNTFALEWQGANPTEEPSLREGDHATDKINAS